jgi:hypothetical protein
MNDKMERFIDLIETFEKIHGKFDASSCLRCIEIARKEMMAGKYTVESFMRAKELLLGAVKCDSEQIN